MIKSRVIKDNHTKDQVWSFPCVKRHETTDGVVLWHTVDYDSGKMTGTILYTENELYKVGEQFICKVSDQYLYRDFNGEIEFKS